MGPMGPWAPWGPWGPWGPHGPQLSQCSPIGKNFFQKKYPKIQNVNFGGENQSCSHRNSAHFGTHTVSWGPLNDSFPDFQFFAKLAGIAISVCSGSPPRDRHLRLLRQPPSRDRHLWPSKSSVRGFGYDYDYGYGYVKSVDSMDNVNSVRSAGPIVNSMDNVDNSAVIRRRGGTAMMKGAVEIVQAIAQRTLLTLSMLCTLLT